MASSDWTSLCKAHFALLDRDGSGFIDKEELHAVLVELDGSWTREHSSLLFEAIDANDDDRIDYEELVDWISGVTKAQDISIDTEDALRSLYEIVGLWTQQCGKPGGPRRAVSGQLKRNTSGLVEDDPFIMLTITALSGRSEQLSHLKPDQPFQDVLKHTQNLFQLSSGSFQLLLENKMLKQCHGQASISSLGLTNGAKLTLLAWSHAALDESTVEDFELGDVVIDGRFSEERLAVHKVTGAFYLVSVRSKLRVCREKRVAAIHCEKALLKELSHPFLMKMHASFQDASNLYVVFNHCPGGDLYGRLKQARKFDADTVRFYVGNIVLALEYLHSNFVIHRCIFPENCFLEKDGYLKIGEFCRAKRMEAGMRTYTQCGTPEYMAPEVLCNRGCSMPVDWWSVGIVTYEMFVGQFPFRAEDHLEICRKILNGKIYFPKYTPPAGRSITKLLCVADVTKRGNSETIRSLKFFKDFDWKALSDKILPAPWVPEVEHDGDLSLYPFRHSPSSTSPSKDGFSNDLFASW